MTLFLLRRILGFAATLFMAALIIFLLLDLLPGDPARFILGINATPEAVAALRVQMGLDAPAHERFFDWVMGLLWGDLGQSHTQGLPVAELVAERMAVTLPLALIAMVVSVVIGLPIGIVAAMRRGKATDTALMVLAQTGVAVPNFWFGMLLTLLFAVTLRWLPTGGYVPITEDFLGWVRSMTLPALTLAFTQMGVIARMTRSSMLDVMGEDYVRTARAKGMRARSVVFKHALRNALLPIVTVLGVTVGVVAWGYLVKAAIDFGVQARSGTSSAWLYLALAAIGAVACLFIGLMLVARLMRVLGITSPPHEPDAPRPIGGRRAAR